MKENIVFISQSTIENEEKYHQYARKKAKVTSLHDGLKEERVEYLDDPKFENSLNLYKFYLDTEKRKIHVDSLNKTFNMRVLANVVAIILSFAEMLVISGLSNMILGSIASAGVVSTISLYTSVAAIAATFFKMNQKNKYYTKKQIQILDKLNKELQKCQTLDKEVLDIKEKKEEYDYQRLQIDTKESRERNMRRNFDMKQDEKRRVFEASQRVDKNARIDAVKRQETINNSRFRRTEMARNLKLYEEDLEKYKQSRIVKNNSFKKVLKNAGNWLMDGFIDDENPLYEVRGSRGR